MGKRWLLSIAALVALLAGRAGAQADLAAPIVAEERAYSLEELTRLADEYNPILTRDQAQIDFARGQALQASLYPNPKFDPNNPQVFAGRNSLFYAGVSQEIVLKGKKQLDTAAATKVVRQSEVALAQDRFALYGAVRVQYFRVLAAQKRVEVLTLLQRIVQQALETGKKLQKAGDVARIDTLLLDIDLQKVQADLRKSESLLDGERKKLAAVVGLPSLRFATLIGDLDAPLPEFHEEVLRTYVSSRHTAVRLAGLDVERSRILLRRAEVEPWPNPIVGPAYQYGLQPGAEQFWLYFQCPMPLWDRNQGNIQSAAAGIRTASENLRAIQNDLLRQASDVLSQHRAARQRVEKYRNEIIPNLKETQQLAQSGYSKGVFDFARFLQAQRTVIETSKDYVDVLEEFWTTAAQLSALLQLDSFP
ncbi:MAG: TolC family protein [Planctomycetes bacterium]|nr:TolC family protein [Planctomycetota bacterium]